MSDQLEAFTRHLCERVVYFKWILTITVTFSIIQIPYLFFAEQGTALYTVSVLNLVGLFLFGGISGGVLWHCKKRAHRRI